MSARATTCPAIFFEVFMASPCSASHVAASVPADDGGKFLEIMGSTGFAGPTSGPFVIHLGETIPQGVARGWGGGAAPKGLGAPKMLVGGREKSAVRRLEARNVGRAVGRRG